MLLQALRHVYESAGSSREGAAVDLAAEFNAAAAMHKARSQQKALFADLNYPNKKQYRAFPSYACMSDFAEQHGCKRILEIGAGLSTAVWASFAARNGASISSIDANFSRPRSYIRNTRHDALVSKHVEMIEGVSINSDEFVDFYTSDPVTSFAGIGITALREHINTFQNRNCSIKRWLKVNRIAGQVEWSARDLMTDASSLSFPRKLLDLFSSNGNFDDEVAFLRDAESRGVAGAIADLVQKGSSWDLVFFDSGELASMIEWPKLKTHIVVGGLAAFHDVFFPKSIKNIVCCAAVLADPDWELIFCDNSTKQGLLIAKRLR